MGIPTGYSITRVVYPWAPGYVEAAALVGAGEDITINTRGPGTMYCDNFARYPGTRVVQISTRAYPANPNQNLSNYDSYAVITY
eukprot:90635-Rhodomonas_salina.1